MRRTVTLAPKAPPLPWEQGVQESEADHQAFLEWVADGSPPTKDLRASAWTRRALAWSAAELTNRSNEELHANLVRSVLSISTVELAKLSRQTLEGPEMSLSVREITQLLRWASELADQVADVESEEAATADLDNLSLEELDQMAAIQRKLMK